MDTKIIIALVLSAFVAGGGVTHLTFGGEECSDDTRREAMREYYKHSPIPTNDGMRF